MKHLFLIASIIVIGFIGCTETIVKYIEVEPEIIVEIDSLSQWDGFWIIPFPEGAINLNVEINAYPDNDDFWAQCYNFLINEIENRIEIYDSNRGYAGRFYRLSYYLNKK